MHDFTDNLEVEKNKQENAPIELYRVYLDTGTEYLAAHPVNVSFFDENGSPVIYLAADISRGPIRTNRDQQQDETTVTWGNITKEASVLIANTKFIGRRLQIIKIFWTDTYVATADDYKPVFFGKMDAPVISERAMKVTVVSKFELSKKGPRVMYGRACNHRFGNSRCGVSLGLVSGTVTHISEDHKTITLSGGSEALDYYKDGKLTIGDEKYRVITSEAGDITVDYPFINALVGDAYTMIRGCDKMAATCEERFDNRANFLGFLKIPIERVLRRNG